MDLDDRHTAENQRQLKKLNICCHVEPVPVGSLRLQSMLMWCYHAPSHLSKVFFELKDSFIWGDVTAALPPCRKHAFAVQQLTADDVSQSKEGVF